MSNQQQKKGGRKPSQKSLKSAGRGNLNPPKPRMTKKRNQNLNEFVPSNKALRLLSLSERNAEAAAAAMLYPERIEQRGPRGVANTAVASSSTTLNVNPTGVSASQRFWIFFQSYDPGCPILQYAYSTSGATAPAGGWTAVTNPVNQSALALMAATVAMMGCNINFTPTGSPLTQAGEVRIAYFPSLIAAGSAGATVPGSWITESKINNSGKTLKCGTQAGFTLTGVVGSTQADLDGLDAYATTANANIGQSVMIGYIDGQGQSPAFLCTVTERVEYEPNNQYRAFGDAESSSCDLGLYYNSISAALNLHPALLMGLQSQRDAHFQKWSAGRNFPLRDIKDVNAGSNEYLVSTFNNPGVHEDYQAEVSFNTSDEEEKDDGYLRKAAQITKQVACALDPTGLGQQFGICKKTKGYEIIGGDSNNFILNSNIPKIRN